MDDLGWECGTTGCTGGGTFLLLIAFLWLWTSGSVLLADRGPKRQYLKSIPKRLLSFTFVTVLFFALGWLVWTLEEWILR